MAGGAVAGRLGEGKGREGKGKGGARCVVRRWCMGGCVVNSARTW